MNCRIFVDTACDLSTDYARSLGVELINLPVSFGSQAYHQINNGDFSEFYKKMSESEELPATSQPVFGDLVSLFNEIKEAKEEAVYLTISSGLSGTYESAIKARDLSDYDGIHIVDSLSCIGSLALMAIHMSDLAKKGLSAKEIVDDLNEFKKRAVVAANVTELNHLKKGGRIPGNLALLGSLFHITPFLTMMPDGKLESPVKDRGLKNSIKRFIRFAERYERDSEYPLLIHYTSDKEDAKPLYDYFVGKLGHDNVKYWPIGPVVGTHLGPHTVGLSFVLSKTGNEERMKDAAIDFKNTCK